MSKLLKLYRNAHRPNVSTEKATFWGGLLALIIPLPLTFPLYLAYHFLKDREEKAKEAKVGTVSEASVVGAFHLNGKLVNDPASAFSKNAKEITEFAKRTATSTIAFIKLRIELHRELSAAKGNDEHLVSLLTSSAEKLGKALPSVVCSSYVDHHFLGDISLLVAGSEENSSGHPVPEFCCIEANNHAAPEKGGMKNLTSGEIIAISKEQVTLAKDIESIVKTLESTIKTLGEESHFPETLMKFKSHGKIPAFEFHLLTANIKALDAYLTGMEDVGKYLKDLNHAVDKLVNQSTSK